MLAALIKELRIATRVLLRSPGFTTVSTLTVGIAIGANAAIFTIIQNVILRPLPYMDAYRVVTFTLDATPRGAPELPLSGAGYWHFRNKNHVFTDLGGYVMQTQPLTGDGSPEQLTIAVVTWSFFPVLGVAPQLGHTFTEEDDVPGGPQQAILSYDLWRRRFGGDPGVIGRVIKVNDVDREVIGVMPRTFAFPSAETDLWMALQLDPATQNYGGHFLTPVARLRDDASVESALADVKALIPRLSEVGYTPPWFSGVFSGGATVETLHESIVGDSQRPLFVVFGALAVVFLIACSNIMNLFLVRTKTRTRETAVRLAMGARRGQLIRYTLVESSIIAAAAGLFGIGLAWSGTRVLLRLQPTAIPRLEEVGINLPVLGFIGIVTITASVFLGLLPALRAGAVHVSAALRDGGRSATAGRESQLVRGILVVVQVALAVILLVAAGLMVRTSQAMRRVDPGFNPDHVLSFSISLPPAGYRPTDRAPAFFADLVETIRGMPGVRSAGAVNALPLSDQGLYLATVIADHPLGPNDFPPAFNIRRVTPGYFETMGIPLVEGRVFDASDHEARLGTAIISTSVKSKFWPDASPLGVGVRPSSPAFSRIVGVVGDVRQTGLDQPFDDFIYLPLVDSVGGGVTSMNVVVRTTGDPLALMPAIRSEIARRDANLPITSVHLLRQTIDDSMADTSFTTLVLTIAAAIALILGAVGIYGLIAFIVGERTTEIGTRMSLGAAPGSILRLFLGQAWMLAGGGIAIGIGVSLAATQLLSKLLFGIGRFDPFTFVVAPAVFLGVAMIACLIPASRAAAVDPAIAIRRE